MSKIINYKKYNGNRDDSYYSNLMTFDIAYKDHKKSYFDLNKKHLKIQFPTKNDNYFVKEVYFLGKFSNPIIFIHISDGTSNSTRGFEKKFIADIKYPLNKIISCSNNDLDLSNEKEVIVYIYNDNSDLNCYSALLRVFKISYNQSPFISHKLTSESALLPQEGNDGGVIIEGP